MRTESRTGALDLRHGGALDRVRAEFPDAPLPWIDLSTGINPRPYPDVSLHQSAFTDLPSYSAFDACRRAMASAFSASSDCVLPVAGSELVIRLLPFMLDLQRVAILTPSYADHALSWRSAGCEVVESAEPLALLDDVDAVIICQPNNPDGQSLAPELLMQAREKLAARGGYLIIDEAYADLEPRLSLAQAAGEEGLIILRSSGKFFGLAGLRLGAVLAGVNLLERLQALLGQWNVSGAALEIGQRAYSDKAWQASTRSQLRSAAEQLDGVLEAAGFSIAGGTDLFRYVATPVPGQAHATWQRLAAAGIYTRRFSSQNDYLRIGLPADQSLGDRLVDYGFAEATRQRD